MGKLIAVDKVGMSNKPGGEDIDRKSECDEASLIAGQHQQATGELNDDGKDSEQRRCRKALFAHIGRSAGEAGQLEVTIQNEERRIEKAADEYNRTR